MDKEINIADGLAHFRMGDTLISLDPIDAIMECDRIASAQKDKQNFEYLDEFAAWVKSRTEIDLTRGQSFSLWNAVYLNHAQAQQSFTDALKSLTSTGSTPEA